ncbi:Protein neuralized, partial [Aphelenchoides avenae]
LATADVSGDRLPRLSSLCSICFERPPDATVYKCGHCYCYQCIDDWRQTRAPTRTKGKEHTARPLCPSCRKPIEDIIR